MTILDSYNRWSATYDSDRNLTRDLDRKVTRHMLKGLQVRTVLEAGCGTGKNTSFLALIGERVVALDFSPGMMQLARAKVSAVQFARADLTHPWPCADNSVDLVVCNLVLEHLEDLDFICGQAARVLADDGQFFICELHPFLQYRGAQATIQADATPIPAFVHHISAFLEGATRAGFTLKHLGEWWHDQDEPDGPPRLVSFLFT